MNFCSRTWIFLSYFIKMSCEKKFWKLLKLFLVTFILLFQKVREFFWRIACGMRPRGLVLRDDCLAISRRRPLCLPALLQQQLYACANKLRLFKVSLNLVIHDVTYNFTEYCPNKRLFQFILHLINHYRLKKLNYIN